MAKTLLDGINETLKATQIIAGDSAELMSLTRSNIQVYIDASVRHWNEAIGVLYSSAELPLPTELAEDTITLVADTRDYELDSSLVQIRWPFQDETNGHFIRKFNGEYLDLVNSQPQPANYIGLPDSGVIRPTDGFLYLDRLPTSVEAGRIYKYRYDKDLVLTSETDPMPFSDAVFRQMVPVTKQLWERDFKKTFDEALFRIGVGTAARLLTKQQQNSSWRSYA